MPPAEARGMIGTRGAVLQADVRQTECMLSQPSVHRMLESGKPVGVLQDSLAADAREQMPRLCRNRTGVERKP